MVQEIKSRTLSIREQAAAEVAAEQFEKSKQALKGKLKQLASAKAIVANLEREIDDLEASVNDGSFVG